MPQPEYGYHVFVRYENKDWELFTHDVFESREFAVESMCKYFEEEIKHMTVSVVCNGKRLWLKSEKYPHLNTEFKVSSCRIIRRVK